MSPSGAGSGTGLLVADQREDPKARLAPRTGCAISYPQRAGPGVSGQRRTRLVGGHQEKGATGRSRTRGERGARGGRPRRSPVRLPDPGKGTAIPSGAYDVQRNEGFVHVGITHDTAEFVVESLRRWWRVFGAAALPPHASVASVRQRRGQPKSRLAVLPATPRGQVGTTDHGLSLPAWHE